jgi:NhaP-type Na+/H+ or K+/H+ antiporter
VSSDDVLLGLGLVLVLAVAGQLAAVRLRLPAIVVLLPLGVLAGVFTDVVDPDDLLGGLYQPFVSIAVGVILFEAGLRLSFSEAEHGIHHVVLRLIVIGTLITWLGVALMSNVLFDGLGDRMPWLIGAVLVVTGPTVVLPLLLFVRPAHGVRSVLTWEGVLIDPVGALLGVLVFHVVRSGSEGGPVWRPGGMALSIGTGVAVGIAAAFILLALVAETQRRAPRQTVPVVLMMVVGALVAADLIRDDAGFAATTVMGIVLANQRRIDIAATLEFQTTLVQLLIGVLFILIAASVSPSEIEAVLPEALILVAVMVLIVRPLGVAASTAGSHLTTRERAFVAWMAPRGIVAGATASAFGLQLANEGIEGADLLLPIVFVVIFTTVVLYGLTAAPVARLLRVAGSGGTCVLIIGGGPPARELALSLKEAGVGVRLWVGRRDEQDEARAHGLDAARGRLLVDAVSREIELEEVTDALLLTANDDFNALAAAELRTELGHGHVHRVAPDPDDAGVLAPGDQPGILADDDLTLAELEVALAEGGRFELRDAGSYDGMIPLFVVGPGGARAVSASDERPQLASHEHVLALAKP